MSDINITVNDEIVNIDVLDTPVYVEVTNSPGQQGPAGVGVPVGGTTGQVLAKNSATNYDTAWVNASGGGVPYSGATGNVNLGEYELKAGQLTLDVSPTGTAAVGTTRWNDTIGSSETTLKGGSVILKNGVDLVARVVNKVTPNTTLTKAAYQAVRVSGAQGQRLAVAFAQANNDNNSADTIGLVIETIATNQEGFIITVGQIENINTTGSLQGETWADGDVLYLSPTIAGAITNVKPTGNGHLVIIGYVEYAHANNGKIYCKITNGYELTELHDVDIVSPANNEALIYESSSALWKNKSITTALGYTPANAATTLTINGVTYDLSTSRTWNISAGISGSIATGQVAYATAANTIGGSNNLFWDNANGRLGIGTNAPTVALDVRSDVSIRGSNATTTANALTIQNSATTTLFSIRNDGNIFTGVNVNFMLNSTLPSRHTATNYPAIFIGESNSGVMSDTTTGYKGIYLMANTVRNVTLGNFTCQDTAQPAWALGMLYDTGFTDYYAIFRAPATSGATSFVRLFMISGNGNVGINTNSPTARLDVRGDTLLRGSGATFATSALKVQNTNSIDILTVQNGGNVIIGQVGTVATLYMSSVGDSRFEKSTSGTNGIQVYGPSNAHHTLTISSFNSDNYSNGALSSLRFNGNYVSSAGSTAFSYMLINGTINQTGTSTSITRGLYVNPTLTAAADFRAIETARGNIVFSNLPTSSAGLPSGALWNNGGVINIV